MELTKILKNFQINDTQFKFQFQSHPNYPSALAFSDTLNFLGVKNEAYELEKEYWEELPEKFITLYKNNFALVEKQNNGYKVSSENEEQVSKEELLKNSINFVLLFEEKKVERKLEQKTNHTLFIYLLFVFFLLYSIFQLAWFETVSNALSILGIYISLEIFNKKFGKESVMINNLCGSGAKISSADSCSKLINSDKLNIIGLKLSDFSLVYFSAILIIGLFLPATGLVLKVITFFSALVILYSLIIQIFIEKTICKICLFIIAVLVVQIVIAGFFFGNIFSIASMVLCAIVFLITFFGVSYINDILKEKEEYRKSNIKNMRLRRNYDAFKRALFAEEKYSFKNATSGFFFGKKNAKLRLFLISNPYCSYCKEAHKIVETIIKKYTDVSLQIRFNFKDEEQTEYIELMALFWNLYIDSPSKSLEAMDDWYEGRDLNKIKIKYGAFIANNAEVEMFSEIGKENSEKGFNFTPLIFINGWRFPDIYERSDLHYFIDEFLEDEELVNEKSQELSFLQTT